MKELILESILPPSGKRQPTPSRRTLPLQRSVLVFWGLENLLLELCRQLCRTLSSMNRHNVEGTRQDARIEDTPCQGELVGWHYGTKQPVRVRWQDRTISQIEPAETTPPADTWLAPPLFDLQINGYAGIDFQQDGLSIQDLLVATRQLRLVGCSRFLLTLITDDWSKLIRRLTHLRELRAQSSELQSAVTGWHIEGPFLSAEPGFRGAHDAAFMLDPTPEHILELRALTDPDPLLITLAPERHGALEAVRLAASLGMKVSLGHTNAPAEILQLAIEGGANAFTHLGNGCPQQLDRHDNIIWRVLDNPRLLVSLIPDQIHVSPQLFRLIHRILEPERIYYTTDAMSAAGAAPGRYALGKLQLEVGPDQIVRQPGQRLFAGSALRPIDGVLRAAQMLGCPWQEAWRRFSEAPAKVMGLQNELRENQPGFCVIKLDNKQRPLEVSLPAHQD
jgi:N-acetylglucosamine-6-phosphate deacetylase